MESRVSIGVRDSDKALTDCFKKFLQRKVLNKSRALEEHCEQISRKSVMVYYAFRCTQHFSIPVFFEGTNILR